ncbi:MAG: plasmid pRiA4b ORF-3 family protein [bacterium]
MAAKARMTWVTKPENAIQFKVTLRDIKPPIWRRVVLPDNCSLGQLHDVIQVAMGWHNCHMHTFRIDGVFYSSKQMAEMDDMGMGMERDDLTLLRNIAGRPKLKFIYEYDLGDSWVHEIVVEKILPIDPLVKHPICLAGARACPPEDCGSIPGYCDILAALKASKKTAEQKELIEWLEGDFDPEHFDITEVNKQLAAG